MTTSTGLIIGALAVRRSALINATTQRVWQEFTDFDRISAWLSRGHTLHQFDLHVGGDTVFSVNIEGKERHFGGKVIVWQPEQEVSFESQWTDSEESEPPTFWTIRLRALYEQTHVELFHHGFERLGAQAAENLQGYESGWDNKHLLALRNIIEG